MRRDEPKRPPDIKKGGKINVNGAVYTVKDILYQDVALDYDGMHPNGFWHYYLEFIDTNGGYHYWKQQFDGGYVVYDSDKRV